MNKSWTVLSSSGTMLAGGVDKIRNAGIAGEYFDPIRNQTAGAVFHRCVENRLALALLNFEAAVGNRQ